MLPGTTSGPHLTQQTHTTGGNDLSEEVWLADRTSSSRTACRVSVRTSFAGTRCHLLPESERQADRTLSNPLGTFALLTASA